MEKKFVEAESCPKKIKGKVSVALTAKTVKLPPVGDILILSKKCPHGRIGISRCMGLLAPDVFELVELYDEVAEVMLVNKNLLIKMSCDKIIRVLKETVFPSLVPGEIVSVTFEATFSWDNIEV